MHHLQTILYLLALLLVTQQRTKPELRLATDFLPTTEAFTDMKLIQTEYQKFKTKITKNITTDYDACINSLETLKCNNIDQWQSVIEELQLEIKNSQDIELPFLENKKTAKTDKLKSLLDVTESQNEQIKTMLEALGEAQKEFETNSQEINQMFRLPAGEAEFIQVPINVPQELNANVPDIAQQQLTEAAKSYEIGDQSIQAQTTSKEMHEAALGMVKTVKSLQASFEAKQKRMQKEKIQLKEDIIRLRALITNEHDIQVKNQQKINEMKHKIQNCKGMPTSLEKDCLPIKLKGDKLNTELEILNSRTLLLTQHIQQLMNGFESEEQIAESKEKQEAEKKLEKAKEMDKKFTEEKQQQMPGFQPKEQEPVMHFNNEEKYL